MRRYSHFLRRRGARPAAARPSDVLRCVLTIACLLSSSLVARAQDHIEWQSDVAAAQQLASQQHRLVLLHFWSENCAPCLRLENSVFKRRDFIRAVHANYVPVKLNVNEHRELARRYNIKSIPTDVIVTPEGREVFRSISPGDVGRYVGLLDQVAAHTRLAMKPMDPGSIGGTPDHVAIDTGEPSPPVTAPIRPPVAAQQPTAAPLASASSPTARPPTSAFVPAHALPADPYAPEPEPSEPARPAPTAPAAPLGPPNTSVAIRNPYYGAETNATDRDFDASRSPAPNTPPAANESQPLGPPARNQVTTNSANPLGPPPGAPARAHESRPLGPPTNAPQAQFSRYSQPSEQAAPPAADFAGSPPASRSSTLPSYAPPSDTTPTPQAPADTFSVDRSTARHIQDFVPFAAQAGTSPPAGSGANGSRGAGESPPSEHSSPGTQSSLPPIAPTAPNAAPTLALDGYCPVTLVEESRWQPGDSQISVVYEQRIYWFASAEHAQRFQARPQHYAPVLAGHDLVEWKATGRLVPGKREHGVVYRNQYYLFASEQSLQQFWQAPDAFVEIARQAYDQRPGDARFWR